MGIKTPPSSSAVSGKMASSSRNVFLSADDDLAEIFQDSDSERDFDCSTDDGKCIGNIYKVKLEHTIVI